MKSSFASWTLPIFEEGYIEDDRKFTSKWSQGLEHGLPQCLCNVSKKELFEAYF